MTAITKLIPRAGRKVPPPITVTKFAKEPPNGRKVGVCDCSTTFGRKDELIIQ